MQRTSLFRHGRYSCDWHKDFYAQAGIWWGPDPQEPDVHPARVRMVDRLCGPGLKRILELGAGSGASAAALAGAGHDVTALDLTPRDAEYTRALVAASRPGSLRYLEADYYTVTLEGRFDVVCFWEGFGLRSDADQRRLLLRVSREWLAPGGSLLMDVYNPARPARDAGKEVRLKPLAGVPGSVEMIERTYFDPVHSYWIDEWCPVAAPERALAQAIRCYSPVELLLLLEGTGLALKHIEVDGEPLDWGSDAIIPSGALLDAWSYLAQLVPAVG